MGRRARTNCSPIDSAMEKYHNDIGSRLSGVFVPPQPNCMDNGSNPTDALSMLTLDMRSNSKAHNNANHHVEVNDIDGSQLPDGHCDSKRERHHCPGQYPATSQNLEKSQTLPASLAKSASLAMSVDQNSQKSQESSNSCAEDKEKRGLVDKISRALFQRKHTCSRCQRKSRSCLPNKNFNSTEKHYTCGRCRETSDAMKSLVSGQNTNDNYSIPLHAIRLTNNNGDAFIPKPRIHLKDSGYDTVTSCSTVASSHSHNSAIHGTPTKNQVPINSQHVADDFNQRVNNTATPFAPALSASSSNPQLRTQGVFEQTSYANPTGLEQFMGVTPDDSSARVLKQVKTRYVENYDGYLPNGQASQACVVRRPALPMFDDPTSHDVGGRPSAVIDNAYTYGSSDQECVHAECRNHTSKSPKVCYTCGSSAKPCFRLPWAGGWLCEDCLDGVF